MISLNDILIILFVHTLFDWCLQTRWQANNKHKSLEALGKHVEIYIIGLIIASFFLFDNMILGMIWASVNAVLHFITDFITSRRSRKFKKERKDWLFIVNAGVDQFIHYATLFITLEYLK